VFQVSDEDLARAALWEGTGSTPYALQGITLDRLISEGPLRLNIPDRFTPFAEGRFPTESGKCELYSRRMADAGLDPLPGFTPPAESVESDPKRARRFPLQMISPPSPHFLNSTFVNIDSLRRAARRPELEIHSDDAVVRNIREGDRVRVMNDRGSFEAIAMVGESVRPGVVVAPGIWWNKLAGDGANANATTSSRLTDMGGGATFFDNLVEVVSMEK
jgi:anaerobic selenocysteine-containing dehydrogenase